MMSNYPYFSFPFYRRYPGYNYNYNYYNRTPKRNNILNNYGQNVSNPQNKSENNKKEESKTNRVEKVEKEAPIFEILGIKLYSDDILIVTLLFFLYSGGVKDQSLFISLIMLLLS